MLFNCRKCQGALVDDSGILKEDVVAEFVCLNCGHRITMKMQRYKKLLKAIGADVTRRLP